MPMALYSKASVQEDAGSSAALRAVARAGGEEWRKGSRRSRERQVERALCLEWVANAMVQRSARMLAHINDRSLDGIDLVRVGRFRALVAKLPSAWAVTEVRMYLNMWTMSHRCHDHERDVCYFGCKAIGSLSH